SFKTWRIFQVIMVVFILLATLPFYYLAAQTLKTHQAWRTLIKTQQDEIDKLTVENRDLQEGATSKDPQLVGIRELKVQLHDLVRDRGEVWRGATPEKVDDAGLVELKTKDPHGIVPTMILFLFEEAAAGQKANYLGEFKVTEASGSAVKMEPNLPLDAAGLDELKKSRGPWSLYSTLPLAERDYGYLFWEHHKQQVILDADIAQLKEQVGRITTATKQADEEIKYRTAEKANLTADLARFNAEVSIVVDHLKKIETQYQALRDSLKATYYANVKMAADIARMQHAAAEKI